MKILVDADACPNVIKEILYRASKRTSISLVFVANKPLQIPRTPLIKFVLVGSGFDVADYTIVEMTEQNDLVITADIPLAAQIIEKKAYALNPRGIFYDSDNMSQKLAMRNLMEELRSSGTLMGGGPAPIDKRDQQQFANALDSYLAKFRQK